MAAQTKTAWTPGPWKVGAIFINQSPLGSNALHFGEYRLELPQPSANSNATLSREVANANARLISKAPELVGAIHSLIATLKLYATNGDVSGLLSVQDAEKLLAEIGGAQ